MRLRHLALKSLETLLFYFLETYMINKKLLKMVNEAKELLDKIKDEILNDNLATEAVNSLNKTEQKTIIIAMNVLKILNQMILE